VCYLFDALHANNRGCCGIVMGEAAVMVNHVMMGDGRCAERERRRERCESDQRFYLTSNEYFLFEKPLSIFHY
jgi:hypothetical protein